jgi:hypothetical protein
MTTSPEFATGPRNHRMDLIFLARHGGAAPELSFPDLLFSTAFFLSVSLHLAGKHCGDHVNKTGLS